MKLKDLKQKSQKVYEMIKDECAKKGVAVNDDTELTEIRNVVEPIIQKIKAQLRVSNRVSDMVLAGQLYNSGLVNSDIPNVSNKPNIFNCSTAAEEEKKLKLKDYKKNPVQYAEIKNLCAQMGIVANDETEMSEILRQSSSTEAMARRAAKKLENKRIEKVKNNTPAAQLRRLADSIEARKK